MELVGDLKRSLISIPCLSLVPSATKYQRECCEMGYRTRKEQRNFQTYLVAIPSPLHTEVRWSCPSMSLMPSRRDTDIEGSREFKLGLVVSDVVNFVT